jgi:YegS/Rv2252/BmrU family lipid kinase
MAGKGHKIAVVVNPFSGNGRTARQWPKVAGMFEDLMGDFAFLQTEHPGHATNLVRQALREGYDRIISVGGDGTHHEVLNGFYDGMLPVNPRAAMAIMPLGTGSDLARTLGMPKGLNAVPHLVSDHVVTADLGRATFSLPGGGQQYLYFINTCHIGMGGAVVERANRHTKWYGGFLTYLWAVVKTLALYRSPYLELDIDGVQLDQVCRDVIIAKGQYDGGGMHVAPNAEINNGLFDVYVIGDTSRMFCLRHMRTMYQGRLLEVPDHVRYFRAARIAARSDRRVLINLDGEQPGQLPAMIEVIPKALNIVTASPEHEIRPAAVAAPRSQPEAEKPANGPPAAPEPPEPAETSMVTPNGEDKAPDGAGQKMTWRFLKKGSS